MIVSNKYEYSPCKWVLSELDVERGTLSGSG